MYEAVISQVVGVNDMEYADGKFLSGIKTFEDCINAMQDCNRKSSSLFDLREIFSAIPDVERTIEQSDFLANFDERDGYQDDALYRILVIKDVMLGRPLAEIPGTSIFQPKPVRAPAPKAIDNKALVALIKSKVPKETFEGWLAVLDVKTGRQDIAV